MQHEFFSNFTWIEIFKRKFKLVSSPPYEWEYLEVPSPGLWWILTMTVIDFLLKDFCNLSGNIILGLINGHLHIIRKVIILFLICHLLQELGVFLHESSTFATLLKSFQNNLNRRYKRIIVPDWFLSYPYGPVWISITYVNEHCHQLLKWSLAFLILVSTVCPFTPFFSEIKEKLVKGFSWWYNPVIFLLHSF